MSTFVTLLKKPLFIQKIHDMHFKNLKDINPTLFLLKFIYSEKATKFCEIFPLLLTTVHTVKSKGKISQNFVAFLEYTNFKWGQRNVNFSRAEAK